MSSLCHRAPFYSSSLFLGQDVDRSSHLIIHTWIEFPAPRFCISFDARGFLYLSIPSDSRNASTIPIVFLSKFITKAISDRSTFSFLRIERTVYFSSNVHAVPSSYEWIWSFINYFNYARHWIHLVLSCYPFELSRNSSCFIKNSPRYSITVHLRLFTTT